MQSGPFCRADCFIPALLVAGLTGSALDGAVVMALFALGTTVSMMLGPWLWLRFGANSNGDWGVRLAGLALVASAAWALWMAYAHDKMRRARPFELRLRARIEELLASRWLIRCWRGFGWGE